VRIIAGSIKGRRLQAPEAKVRPTADRAREALFSILRGWPQGPFLDLFAGTGAVALEAWSRGYGPVACVERDTAALACARLNARETGLSILAQDVLRLAKDAFPPQAVVFADPPYEASAELWRAMAPRVMPWLRADGLLVWETGHSTELAPPDGLELVASRRYGAAVFHLFRLA
jgi:16S rRNA (guanine966-N2)-methyltransferase